MRVKIKVIFWMVPLGTLQECNFVVVIVMIQFCHHSAKLDHMYIIVMFDHTMYHIHDANDRVTREFVLQLGQND